MGNIQSKLLGSKNFSSNVGVCVLCITDYVNLLLCKFCCILSQRLIFTPHTVSQLAQTPFTSFLIWRLLGNWSQLGRGES
jgi:hypothetical protein